MSEQTQTQTQRKRTGATVAYSVKDPNLKVSSLQIKESIVPLLDCIKQVKAMNLKLNFMPLLILFSKLVEACLSEEDKSKNIPLSIASFEKELEALDLEKLNTAQKILETFEVPSESIFSKKVEQGIRAIPGQIHNPIQQSEEKI